MDIATFLGSIGEGISTFVPDLVGGMLEAFTGLFFVVETGAITGLSPLGMASLSFFVIGLCYKFLPTVLGWLKTRSARRKKARAAK